jgi:hypothetical protein
MSGRNGDKSRFGYQRKRKLQRRDRNRELKKQLLGEAAKPAALKP